MPSSFDVIVVGLGAMGSAAACHLAERGRRVLGLEQFAFGHDRGSSHGASRVIRLAYFEHPSYVPLLLRAYDLWERLERGAGQSLLTITGGLMIGRPESDVVSGSLRSAREHALPHEMLDASEIHRRFPPFTPASDQCALYEPRAGVLRPEACVHAHLDLAAAAGADLRAGVRVVGWDATPNGGVAVRTSRGTVEAAGLILSPGAWAPDVFGVAGLPLEVERQVLYWFDPVGGSAPFSPDRFPIYIWDRDHGVQFYGFPAQAGPPAGVKVAFYRTGEGDRCTADTVDRTVRPDEVAAMRAALGPCLPSLAAGPVVQSVTCMYTLTPDHHFVIGTHPDHPQVIVASPCSGHGFKFASVVGEILADLATTGASPHPIELFSPTRFRKA